MKHYSYSYILAFFFCVITLCSCEQSMFLRSEKKMNEKIQGAWAFYPLMPSDQKESWTFKDKRITRNDSSAVTIDVGDYVIKTTLSSVYITISGFKTDNPYNNKWEIITLDKNTLVMVTKYKDPGTSSLFERDFSR